MAVVFVQLLTTTKQVPKSLSASRSQKVMKTRDIPAAQATVVRPYYSTSSGPKTHPGSMVVRGMELISQLSVTNSTAGVTTFPIATNIFQTELSPTSDVLDGTRLSRIAQTFDKFLFKKMTFHFDSVTGTSSSGAIVLAYDVDPVDDTPPATVQGFQNYTSMRNSIQTNIWLTQRLPVKVDGTVPPLFTTPNSPDERFYYQGQVYAALAAPMTVPPTTTVAFGNLYLEYEVLLLDPSLEAGLTIVGAMAAPVSIPSSTASFKYNLLNDTDINSAIQQSGKYKLVDSPDTNYPGKAIQFQNAGEFLMNMTGFSSNTSGPSAPAAGYIVATDWVGGSGVTLDPVWDAGANQLFTTGSTKVGGLGAMLRVSVDPKSNIVDRWLIPAFASTSPVWEAGQSALVRYWWSLMSAPLGLNKFPSPVTPSPLLLIEQYSQRESVRGIK